MADDGIWVPESARRAGMSSHDDAVHRALSLGRRGSVEDPAVTEMRKNRRVMAARTQKVGSSSQVSFATGRPRDPMFYWEQNNVPWDINKPEELRKVREYCRVLYRTHPVLASAIDIYSKYPLTGMELVCKDEALTEFYTTLFFDQLKYPRYLKSVGREYWTVGEAWPFGSFNETLGVWEDDELLNPDDIEVHRSPFLKEPRFEMRLPQTLRKVLVDKTPKWEYDALLRAYPELRFFTREDARMSVSNILLRQLRFDADTFHPRGVPILMRGFRAIMQEEMLNAAQDAIADRLYTPLLVAKLGASATDLGTTQPWIPNDDDIAEFEEALDMALAADFRVLIHNFALEMTQAYGRETMPNMDADFDRLEERQLQVFGLSKTMLSGGSSGETYAADALNRDLISQLLTDYQDLIKDLYRERALVVAEAQEHFDFEVRGGKRYPIMEEILEVDEEGNQRIVEQPKLLIPELKIKAMNLQDEQQERQLVEALREGGVPISMKTRLMNINIDLNEEIETTAQEQIEQAVKAQEVRRDTYLALKSKGLPIPEDLREDFEPKAANAATGSDEKPLPTIGLVSPAPTTALAPTPDELAAAQDGVDTDTAESVVPLRPRNRMMDHMDQAHRPPESDEMRAGMPRPAGLRTEASLGDPDRDPTDEEIAEHPGIQGPRHVGMRRHAGIDKTRPLDEQVDIWDGQRPKSA